MDIENLTKDTKLTLKNYHGCIQAIVFNDSHDRCYLGDCLDCPKTSILRKHLLKCFDENDIFQIEYQSWFDRSVYNSFENCKCARIYGHTGGQNE